MNKTRSRIDQGVERPHHQALHAMDSSQKPTQIMNLEESQEDIVSWNFLGFFPGTILYFPHFSLPILLISVFEQTAFLFGTETLRFEILLEIKIALITTTLTLLHVSSFTIQMLRFHDRIF